MNDEYTQFEREQINSTVARQQYARYLEGLPWDYFITSTFRHPRRDSLAANEAVWDTLATCGVERAFLAVERHRYPSKDCHVHGLVACRRVGLPGLESVFETPGQIWQGLYQYHGRARVEEIRSVSDVGAYCAKYVVKRLSEYGFYGAPELWRA